MSIEVLPLREQKMETDGHTIEIDKSRGKNFPPWSISDVLVCIAISYTFLYFLTTILEATVFKDMSLEFYGSREMIDKVVILILGAIVLVFSSCFLFLSINILHRYSLRLLDIGLLRSLSWNSFITSIIVGFIYGHLIYLIVVYLLVGGSPSSWQIKGISGKLYLDYALPIHLTTIFYVSIVEEVFYRGISYLAFRKTYGIKLGILFSSTLFTLCHIQNVIEEPMISFSIFLSGLILCSIYEKSGSLLPPIIVHIIINTITILFSYNIHPFGQDIHQIAHEFLF